MRAARSTRLGEVVVPVTCAVGTAVLVVLQSAGHVPASVILVIGALATLVAAHRTNQLRTAVRERDRAAARLHRVSAEHRTSDARMHEIRSTVAGIVSATRLLRSLPEDRRESFESMVDAEMERLLRILHGGSTDTRTTVSLDELLAHLVTSHRARGRSVQWSPSGMTVTGRYDDVAEAINVLIDNAAVHGNPDDIRVATAQVGGTVRLTVSDSGPGVPAELRERIFQWGEQRTDSPGDGIGLHLAHTLVTELGGALILDDDFRAGARFIVNLPAATPAAPAAQEAGPGLLIAS